MSKHNLVQQDINYHEIREAIAQIKDPLVRQQSYENLVYLIDLHKDIDAYCDHLLSPKPLSERTTQIIRA